MLWRARVLPAKTAFPKWSVTHDNIRWAWQATGGPPKGPWRFIICFYACGIQIRCIKCIEWHAFWLAKPSGASHIWNSIHSQLFCMFRSSGVHYGQNSFKYLQNISPIIPWLSFVISIILEGHFVFWVMHFICSYLTLACYSNLA